MVLIFPSYKYIHHMNEERAEFPNLPDYVSIKEAAKILGISDKTVYEYVNTERLPAVWAADVLMIKRTDLENFQRKPVGRPRVSIPKWRISSKDNALFVTSINVQVRAGKRDKLMKKLEEIRRRGLHNFPGTVARYITGYKKFPGKVEILLIWKTSAAPDEASHAQALAAFQQALADVLDWDTAEYDDGTVYIHT